MNILQRLWFRAKTGADINVLNNGEPVSEVVIKYKDKYLCILESEEGEICSLTWTENIGFISTPVREFWSSKPPRKK